MVEHGDPVGERHDDADIVLDQHDRRAEPVARITDEAAHLLLLARAHAGHRLVQQQEPRLARSGRAPARPASAARRAGWRPGGAPRPRGRGRPGSSAAAPGSRIARAGHGGRPSTCPRGPAARRWVSPIATLSSTSSPGNSARFWNVRATPSAASFCVGTACERRPPMPMRAAVRAVDAADQVDQRALAGAVRADDRPDLAARRPRGRHRPGPRSRRTTGSGRSSVSSAWPRRVVDRCPRASRAPHLRSAAEARPATAAQLDIAPACMRVSVGGGARTRHPPPVAAVWLRRWPSGAAWHSPARGPTAARAGRKTRPPPGSAGSRRGPDSRRSPSVRRSSRRSVRACRPDRS